MGISSCTDSSTLGFFSIVGFKNRVPGRLCEFDEAIAGALSEYNKVDAGFDSCAADGDSVTGIDVE